MKKREATRRAGNRKEANVVSSMIYDMYIYGMTPDEVQRKYKSDKLAVALRS